MVGGQQSARSLPHLAELFRLADRAGLLRDPDLARRPHERACWPCTGSPDARARGRSLAPVDQHGDGAQAARPACHHRGLRAARHRRRLSRGAIRCRQPVSMRRHGRSGRPASASPATAAAASFPLPMPPACAPRCEDNRKAVDEAKAIGAPCLVLVVGALPGALAGKPAHKDIGLARAQVFDGIAATLEYARSVGMPLAIEPLHPMQARRPRLHQHAGARARHLRCARPGADRSARRRGRHLPCLVGPQARSWNRSRRRQAPARLPRLRLAGADPRSPQRPRHDGRRHRGAEEGAWPGRGGGLHRPGGGRDLLRYVVGRPAEEVLDTCIARFRSVV